MHNLNTCYRIYATCSREACAMNIKMVEAQDESTTYEHVLAL